MTEKEKDRKYNIGDKVVKFNVGFYDNPYHKNKFAEFSCVSDIHSYPESYWRGNVFYVYGHKHEVDSIGDSRSYQPYECKDETGIETESIGGRREPERWYHVEKDREEIQQLLSDVRAEFAAKCKEAREKAIALNKSKIKSLQREIDEYERGDVFPMSGFSKKSESEWNSEMDALIAPNL